MALVKSRHRPYYIQITELLKRRIQSGAPTAARLPPVRRVAHELGVNPNTVQRAYRELKRQGLVSGEVGRGTFVTTTPDKLRQQNRKELLLKSVEHSLEEALSLEFTIEEYEGLVGEFLAQKRVAIRNVKLAFIECNMAQLTYFSEHLELDPHIQRLPILLADLHLRRKQALSDLARADVIVTSLYHLDEIRQRFEVLDKPILGINLEPQVATLIEIARIPPSGTVGIITRSVQFRDEIKGILRDAGLTFRRMVETHAKDKKTLRQAIARCDAVLASPGQMENVAHLAPPQTKTIEVFLVPDKLSVNNLKIALLELKKSII